MAGPTRAPYERRGKPASPGRAVGPAHRAPVPRLDPAALPDSADPGAANPGAALRAAILRAAEELRALAGPAGRVGIDVLDFQIEMLLDEEILAPALERIRAGESAALAWAGAMNELIDTLGAGVGPEGAEDAFALRAADLADLKQRVLDTLAGRPRGGFPEGAVYVGTDMPPSVFLAHDWSKGGGIALTGGSTAGHLAVLARARGVPMVIGLGGLDVEEGSRLLVDGDEGLVRSVPAAPSEAGGGAVPSTASAPAAPAPSWSELPAAARGAVRLCVNLNALSDLDRVDPASTDGVGLVRTEFMFLTAAEALNEELHLDRYRRIIERFGGRPVTLRMLDLGGDKVLPGLVEGGPSSVLGERGVRVLLAHPELARLQARAMLRAAALGPVSVLVPMVTLPEEMEAIARLFDQEAARLERLGVPARRPALGMMVEVPAAALTLDQFAAAAFFSVGTNDLMQYLSAAARDNPAVAHFNARSEPALFRLLDQVCAAARDLGKPVSVCGDLAGEGEGLRRLVECGFRAVSVAPSRLAAAARLLGAGAALPAGGAGG